MFNNSLRHPAVLAQDLASIDVLSGGRLDIAIGAGWNKPEYDAIGLPFDTTPVRQARLVEAIAVLKGAFADGPFNFAGEHYTITDLDGYPKPVQKPHPPFLIGGGGRRTLELAAREAQIVGLAPRILPGQRSDPQSITVAGTAEKIEWVRAAAGDRFDDLELNVYPSGVGPSVTDNALAEARDVAAFLAGRTAVDLTAEEVLESPHIFIGSLASLEEKFIRQREQLGINSIMVGEMGPFDAIVERLAGTDRRTDRSRLRAINSPSGTRIPRTRCRSPGCGTQVAPGSPGRWEAASPIREPHAAAGREIVSTLSVPEANAITTVRTMPSATAMYRPDSPSARSYSALVRRRVTRTPIAWRPRMSPLKRCRTCRLSIQRARATIGGRLRPDRCRPGTSDAGH